MPGSLQQGRRASNRPSLGIRQQKPSLQRRRWLFWGGNCDICLFSTLFSLSLKPSTLHLICGQVLKSQSQVYLPINNALSEHGHVHTFLEQFGQGVQHLASRVQDLISFVERVNNYRQMTGRGFRFLSIPRSCEFHRSASREPPLRQRREPALGAATVASCACARTVACFTIETCPRTISLPPPLSRTPARS